VRQLQASHHVLGASVAQAMTKSTLPFQFDSASADVILQIRGFILDLPVITDVEGHIADITEPNNLQEMSLDELCSLLFEMLKDDEKINRSDGQRFDYLVEPWNPGSPVLSISTRLHSPDFANLISYASLVQRIGQDCFCLLDSHSDSGRL
jgi:hypothetical protein